MSHQTEDPMQATQETVRKIEIEPLEAGDKLDRETFHERYQAMPEGFRAELIGGVVHMPSPTKRQHSMAHIRVCSWLDAYSEATPGTEALDNASALLGPEQEPQPDACLLITPESGGQTCVRDDFVVGAPELIVEVASSSVSIDLHAKKNDYEKFGVLEYVVLAVRSKQIFWFRLVEEKFCEHPVDSDGVHRSVVFPGLWLDAQALFREDRVRVREVAAEGLRSQAHADFVALLAKAVASRSSGCG
jgi:Uma2 family endonuclease